MKDSFFKINSYRLLSGLFLRFFVAPSTSARDSVVDEGGRPTQNIARPGDATPPQGCWDKTQANALDLLTLRLQGVLEDVKGALNGDNGAELGAEYYQKLYSCARALDTLIRYLTERGGEAAT